MKDMNVSRMSSVDQSQMYNGIFYWGSETSLIANCNLISAKFTLRSDMLSIFTDDKGR